LIDGKQTNLSDDICLSFLGYFLSKFKQISYSIQRIPGNEDNFKPIDTVRSMTNDKMWARAEHKNIRQITLKNR